MLNMRKVKTQVIKILNLKTIGFFNQKKSHFTLNQVIGTRKAMHSAICFDEL